MSHRNSLIAIGLVAVLVVGTAGPVAAHDWQTEVEQGDMVLGVNSAPETPIAGMETEFSGSITDTAAAEGEANRTDWGGVTNKQAEVHVNGPDGIHDHLSAHVPEDDSHFHFAYLFPEAGTYTITLVVQIDGTEYAFEFQREVEMLPARAEGETVEGIRENVTELQGQVDELQQQNDELRQQNAELQAQVEELSEEQSAHNAESAESGLVPAGAVPAILFGLLTAVGGFVAGRRR